MNNINQLSVNLRKLQIHKDVLKAVEDKLNTISISPNCDNYEQGFNDYIEFLITQLNEYKLDNNIIEDIIDDMLLSKYNDGITFDDWDTGFTNANLCFSTSLSYIILNQMTPATFYVLIKNTTDIKNINNIYHPKMCPKIPHYKDDVQEILHAYILLKYAQEALKEHTNTIKAYTTYNNVDLNFRVEDYWIEKRKYYFDVNNVNTGPRLIEQICNDNLLYECSDIYDDYYKKFDVFNLHNQKISTIERSRVKII